MFGKKTIIIAEAGVNHNGNFKNIFKLIDIASDCKADYIKFQITDSNIISKKAKKAKYQVNKLNKNETQYAMVKKLEMNWKKIHPILIKRCKKKNIGFLTSIFDYRWAKEIKKLNLDFIKIPSGEINNFPLLKSVANLKKKVLLSTGASTFNEIKNSNKSGKNSKNLNLICLKE